MRRWHLQEAQARLREVVEAALREGPQKISAPGEAAAVVLSKAEYDRLRRRKPSFIEFLRRSPLKGLDLEVGRDRTPPRDVRL